MGVPYERYVTWYAPWPTVSEPSFNRQVRTIRWDTTEAAAVLRKAIIEVDDTAPYYQSEKWLKGLAFGTYNPIQGTTQNKFRFYCTHEASVTNPITDRTSIWCFQVNTGTDASPTWITAFKVDPTLGQVIFGEGGARSLGGWYG